MWERDTSVLEWIDVRVSVEHLPSFLFGHLVHVTFSFGYLLDELELLGKFTQLALFGELTQGDSLLDRFDFLVPFYPFCRQVP